MKSFFPSDLPPAITLTIQSITKPWPRSWLHSYDLVHQRLALPAVRSFSAQDAVTNLIELVNPGGWIQLVEAVFKGGLDTGPAMLNCYRLFNEMFRIMGVNPHNAELMRGWCEEAGLEDVEERVVNIGVGAKNPKPELGAIGIQNVRQAISGFVGFAKCKCRPRLDFLLQFYLKPGPGIDKSSCIHILHT